MSNLERPNMTITLTNAKTDIKLSNHKILLIGASSNQACSQEIQKDITLEKAKNEYGEISNIYLALENFRKYNPINIVDTLGLRLANEGTAKEADWKIGFTGEADKDGIIRVSILDDNFSFDVTIKKGTTLVEIQDAIVAKFNENASKYPFTITRKYDADATINNVVYKSYLVIKSKDKGKVLNKNRIKLTAIGISLLKFDITHYSVGEGTGDYTMPLDLNTIVDRYHSIIIDESMPSDQVTKLHTLLESNFNKRNEIKGGSSFEMIIDTLTNVKTTLGTLDYKTHTVFVNLDEMPYIANPLMFLCEFVAKRALRLTEGQDVSNININKNDESVGGIDKASLPYFNIEMSYNSSDKSISLDNLNILEDLGASFFINNDKTNKKTKLNKILTTDKTGFWKSLNTVDTALAIQEYFFNSFKRDFPQHRSVSQKIGSMPSTVDRNDIRSHARKYYNELIEKSLIDGFDEAKKKFTNSIKVDYDGNKGSFNFFAKICIVGQLESLTGILEISKEI